MVLPRTTSAWALILASALSLGACGHPSDEAGMVGREAAREGLSIPIGGAFYNVFITRQLNLDVVPDSAYYQGPEPRKDETLYGVFLQVCNEDEKPVRTAEHFTIKDSQENEFEPVELPEDNQFAYHAKQLGADECIPKVGSVAQQGPTAGSMLLFRLPLEITENRPLELEIQTPYDPETRKRDTRTIELDL